MPLENASSTSIVLAIFNAALRYMHAEYGGCFAASRPFVRFFSPSANSVQNTAAHIYEPTSRTVGSQLYFSLSGYKMIFAAKSANCAENTAKD